MKPLKKFGQNFLTDRYYLEKVVEAFAPKPGDKILEIGAGKGAITEQILRSLEVERNVKEHHERMAEPVAHENLKAQGRGKEFSTISGGEPVTLSKNLSVVEIDTRAIELLKEKFPGLKIFEGDFMQLSLCEILSRGDGSDEKLRVIGNIPFHLTSPIVFRLLNEREIVRDAGLILQYEVAKRITATPGNKDYGILSVVLSVYATLKFHFKIPASVFFPKPKVDSAFLSIVFDKDTAGISDHKIFRNVVRTAFNQRRKTLRNALASIIERLPDGSKLPVDLKKRAEQLTPEEFVSLSNSITEFGSK
ncbi:MAG: 16S rRNA (adenine(1518)-N(6)/adenine(1519)-N(6))-dimethyltransferase RsmA [Ignavibacteriales bacterium]|nr:MAG: ribosomal RNA small subunit methyltransferase A [Ignavibacteriaceae bacterium]MBW7873820.1 ribosomal RNA small subunit methyltransferase A [Ignavibacteria bacterium]MCZ2144157.1 16S rRNA (adenine(1518)-N(6)/adenine(1519)-N(6))-dimethyltransferase RsmA [Ignavibacteriales bacterium]MBV6445796.1 Ribosomal RNA small subunit methyltransferase A [Ignavibacteriaceae bacterium]MBZ0197088.1 16S rRNA (adenine(1518)-N(6)/adenine(1519)-N(6))-dimethyltransferase RsmA [Ignavibacteriaceae bacterium]